MRQVKPKNLTGRRVIRRNWAYNFVSELIESNATCDSVALAEVFVRKSPLNPWGWIALGKALRAKGNSEAAIAALNYAMTLAPDQGLVYLYIGHAYRDCLRFRDALLSYRSAALLLSDDARPLIALASTLSIMGDKKRALKEYTRAIKIDPENVQAKYFRAHIHLVKKRYAQGWRDQRPFTDSAGRPPLHLRRWEGEALPGGDLVLWNDQGFGDAILAARFIPHVSSRVKRVLLYCQEELRTLFQGIRGVTKVCANEAQLPPAAVQCPLMGLPQMFVGKEKDIPPPARFTIPVEKIEKYHALSKMDVFKVGIVWSGRTSFGGNPLRASALKNFLALLELPDVRLFSLQMGPPAGEIELNNVSCMIHDLAPTIKDFTDTAAILMNLDLVIMTDSSVAHLAASLGKPVWNILGQSPYWIYGESGARTSWYPSMRLFRQSSPGDWRPVFCAVKRALKLLIRRKRSKENAKFAVDVRRNNYLVI